MKAITIAVTLIGLLFAVAGPGTAQQAEVFSATLTGKDATPPVTTDALGAASLTFGSGWADYRLELGSIKNVTSACIHLSTPQPATIMLYTGPQTGAFTGVLTTGTLGPEELGNLTLDELRHAVGLGQAYVSVHTVKYPGGEIQGKLAPTG